MKTTPYAYCANNPTNLIDPNGERIFATSIVSNNYNSLFATYEWTYEYGAWQFIDISTYEPYGNNGYTSVFMNELKYALDKIMSRPFGYSYINDIVTLEEIVVINHSNLNNSNSYKETSGIYMLNNIAYSNIIGVINWYNPNSINEQNFKNFEISTIEGYQINPTTSLIHELAHFYYDAMGGDMNDIWFTIDEVDKYTNTAPKNIYVSEIYTTHIENIVRNEQGFPLRDQYLNDCLNVFGDIDKIINVKNKTNIFFRDGYGLDLIPQNILNTKKGYKYE